MKNKKNKKQKRVLFSDSDLWRGPGFLCSVIFLSFDLMYVHTNNASYSCTGHFRHAALLLSATSLVTDLSPFLRGTREIIFLNYKSHRVNAYKWVWNSTHQNCE